MPAVLNILPAGFALDLTALAAYRSMLQLGAIVGQPHCIT